MSFKLKLSKFRSTPVLKVSGEIVGSNVGKISLKLEALLKLHPEKVAVDLSQTTFIDSHGLGMFVFFFRRYSEEKCGLVFLRPSDFIVDLFTGSNLNKIFTIIDNENSL